MSGVFSEGNRAPWRVLASPSEVDPDFSMNRLRARKVWGLGSRENTWEAPAIVQVGNVNGRLDSGYIFKAKPIQFANLKWNMREEQSQR